MLRILATQIRNPLTPSLARAARTARNPIPILRAMGSAFLSLTLGTFTRHGMHERPKPWPPLKSGKPSWLTRTTTLRKSIRLAVTRAAAEISVPASVPYAPVHQFGSRARKIPARPFFPITDAGKLTASAERKVRNAAQRALERVTKTS